MAKPILVANWKNHPGSLMGVKALLRQLSKGRTKFKKVSLFIAPPLTYFESVQHWLGVGAHLATQDFSRVSKGSHTGAVTPDILKSFGVRLAILGHSESRALGETNASVSEKIKMASSSGIVPLVCVGELTRDSEGEHFEFLREEIKRSLSSLNKKSDISKLLIAYEPVWAIGKGARDAIDKVDLSQSVIFIRKVLTEMFGREKAETVPILYGGSVEPSNAKELMGSTGIRGFLVGHASLNAKNFLEIVDTLITK